MGLSFNTSKFIIYKEYDSENKIVIFTDLSV